MHLRDGCTHRSWSKNTPRNQTESGPRTADEFLPHNRIPVHRPETPKVCQSVLLWVVGGDSLIGRYVINVCERQQKSIRRDIRVSSQGWKSNNYYTWERSDIHLPACTFESMFFLYPKDRICQLGYSSRVLDTWNTHILTSHGTQKLCS